MTLMLAGRPIEMDQFKSYCTDIFAALNRIDQRRAAESYVYGLLRCPGRKSIRRLAAVAPGRNEQSLQQFVNQSPWDPEPIRQRVTRLLTGQLQPVGWALEEVAFPKNGRYSAAVDRQYVRSLGRVCNCQLAVAVVLVAEQISIPVNWRLLIPESWGADQERRSRARMPDRELPRPYWQYHIEVLDDMALEWGLPYAPILVDTRQRTGVEAFLTALELRRQAYVAQISPSLLVGCERRQPRAGPQPIGTGNGAARRGGGAARREPPWWGPAAALIDKTANLVRETVEWRTDQHNGALRSQFVTVPVLLSGDTPGSGNGSGPAVHRRLLIAEWPLSKPQPLGFWITNLVDEKLTELVQLAKRREGVSPRIERFANEFGLRDYEGRTFVGWHHHVTLASAAGAYHQVLEQR